MGVADAIAALAAHEAEWRVVVADRDGAIERLRLARAEHAKEIAAATKALEAERSARGRAERERNRAIEANEALAAENADMLARPFTLDEAQREAAQLRSELRLSRAEIVRLESRCTGLSERVAADDASGSADRAHAAHASSLELQQTRRRLAQAQDANTRLVAEMAALQDQVSQAEQRAEQSRRAMLEHAGRM